MDVGPRLPGHVFTYWRLEGEGGRRRRRASALPSRRDQFFTQAKPARRPPFAARHALYAPTLNAVCAPLPTPRPW